MPIDDHGQGYNHQSTVDDINSNDAGTSNFHSHFSLDWINIF
jgi:hypothetical protein